MEYITEIVVAMLALAGTLSGSFIAHRHSSSLLFYRLEQLEKKVAAHNNLVERTFLLEEQSSVLAERLKAANHRIDRLERA